MPSIIKCKISRARNLQKLESGSLINLQIYCKLSLGLDDKKKTNPFWSEQDQTESSNFKFPFDQDQFSNITPETSLKQRAQVETIEFNKMDDEELQDHALEIKVLQVGNKNLLGIVQLDLTPLTLRLSDNKQGKNMCMKGWFPIYSVHNGINGELYLEVDRRIEHDHNPTATKQIDFFSSKAPHYYEVKKVLGFIEELVEFKRKGSNEMKDFQGIYTDFNTQENLQHLVLKLRRKIGQNVRRKGGNAVITYRQCIDYEGDHCKKIIVRGYGTAVLLDINSSYTQMVDTSISPIIEKNNPLNWPMQKQVEQNNNFQEQERTKVTILTIDGYPNDQGRKYSMYFGSTVSARSVRLTGTDRDKAYDDIRQEIISSANALKCNYVLGYRESISVVNSTDVNFNSQVILFSATGTAVKIRFPKENQSNFDVDNMHRMKSYNNDNLRSPSYPSLQLARTKTYTNQGSFKLKKEGRKGLTNQRSMVNPKIQQESLLHNCIKEKKKPPCTFCHIIRENTKKDNVEDMQHDSQDKATNKVSFVTAQKCLNCHNDYVPEVIVASINPPNGIQIIGTPKLIEARCVQNLPKAKSSEQLASKITEKVFFVEYYLHMQLLTKLKLVGNNAIFCLRTNINISDQIITGVAFGMSVCLKALPIPKPLKIAHQGQLSVRSKKVTEKEQRREWQQLSDYIQGYNQHCIKSLFTKKIFVYQSPYTYLHDLPARQMYSNLMEFEKNQNLKEPALTHKESTSDDAPPINVEFPQDVKKILSVIHEVKSHDELSSDLVQSKKYTMAEIPKLEPPLEQIFEEKTDHLTDLQQSDREQVQISDIKISQKDSFQDIKLSVNIPTESSKRSKSSKLKDQSSESRSETELRFDLPEQFKANKVDLLQPPQQAYDTQNSIRSISEESCYPEKENKEDIILVTNSLPQENKKPGHLELIKLQLSGVTDDKEASSRLRVRTASLENDKNIASVIQNQEDVSPSFALKIARKFSMDAISPNETSGGFDGPSEVQILATKLNKKNQPVIYEKNLSLKGELEINKRGQITLKHKSKAKLEEQVAHYNDNINHLPGSANDFFEMDTDKDKARVRSRNEEGQEKEVINQVVNLQEFCQQINKQREEQEETEKPSFVVELETNKDFEHLKCLIDPLIPPEIILLTSRYDFTNFNWQNLQVDSTLFYQRLFRFSITLPGQNDRRKNRHHNANNQETQFARAMQGSLMELVSDIMRKNLSPCIVCSLERTIKVHAQGYIDVFLTACILKQSTPQSPSSSESDKQDKETNTTILTPNLTQDMLMDQKEDIQNNKLIGAFDNDAGKLQAKSLQSEKASAASTDLHKVHYLIKQEFKDRMLMQSDKVFLPEFISKWIDQQGNLLLIDAEQKQLSHLLQENGKRNSIDGKRTSVMLDSKRSSIMIDNKRNSIMIDSKRNSVMLEKLQSSVNSYDSNKDSKAEIFNNQANHLQDEKEYNPKFAINGYYSQQTNQAQAIVFKELLAPPEKSKTKKNLSQVLSSFFSLCSCKTKDIQVVQTTDAVKNVVQSSKNNLMCDNIALLPMSIAPRKVTKRYFGMIDVHLVRRIFLRQISEPQDGKQPSNPYQSVQGGSSQKQSLKKQVQRGIDLEKATELQVQRHICEQTEEVLQDLNQIVKSRCEALGANCLLGYRVKVNGFEQADVQGFSYSKEPQLFLLVSATGDAVQIDSDSTDDKK